jgi:short-subunit dehydrogenase
MKPIALITWASSWLGIDFAKQLSKRWYHCLLTARSESKLISVQEDIIAAWWSAEIYIADISDMSACERLSKYVLDAYPQIEVVINNAWFGAYGYFQEIDLQTQLNMIDLNCKALLFLTHTLSTQMLLSKTAWYILNVASTAAFQPWPTMATYFASKAFVLSLSQALRFEWKSQGIHVAALCPWATKTAFFDRSNVADSAQMVQGMMRSDAVVKQWLDWLFAKKDVIIPWFMNNVLYYLGLFSPTNMIMWIVQKIMAK